MNQKRTARDNGHIIHSLDVRVEADRVQLLHDKGGLLWVQSLKFQLRFGQFLATQ